MADFTVWERATLEQFAKEATEKLVADRAAIDELVEALQTELGVWRYDREYSVSNYSRLHVDQRIRTISATLTKHTQRKEQ